MTAVDVIMSLATSHDTLGCLVTLTFEVMSTESVVYFCTAVAKDVKGDAASLVWATVVIESVHHLGDDVVMSFSSVAGGAGSAGMLIYPMGVVIKWRSDSRLVGDVVGVSVVHCWSPGAHMGAPVI